MNSIKSKELNLEKIGRNGMKLRISFSRKAMDHTVLHPPQGGFNFDNVHRNTVLEKTGLKMPAALKTGTTIVGLVYKDGVVLGADTRATDGPIVADKNCEKIHYIAPNIYCCGAGTAADTEFVTGLISSQLELHRLNSGRQSYVSTACRFLKQYLFRYQGHVGAALVLGGIDSTGPHLFSIHPHGSTDSLPYVTMGSGSLAAMAMFERGYKDNLELEEAKQLVQDAITAGIMNDLGSGSNVDLCVITKDGVDYARSYANPVELTGLRGKYRYSKGTTPVLTETIKNIKPLSAMVDVVEGDMMDVTA